MKKLRLTALTAAITLSSMTTWAQSTDVTLHVQPADTADMQVFLYELGDNDNNAPMQRIDGTTLRQTLSSSKHGMYSIVYVNGTSQRATPLFFDGDIPTNLTMEFVDDCPKLATQPASKKKADKERAAHINAQLDAIFTFNQVYYKQSRELWTQGPSMTPDDLRKLIKVYDDALQTINSNSEIGENLKQYVDVWAYLLKQECVTVYNRFHGQNNRQRATGNEQQTTDNGQQTSDNGRLDMAKELGVSAAQKLDTPIALLHQGALNAAAQDLPKGTLSERLAYIDAHYKCEEMKQGVQRIVAESFIRSYKFDKGYQEGLSILEEAHEKYGLDNKYIEKFRERIAAVPGAAFPDVELIDTDGNKVSMTQFKGKYVYVDLWASWCVPCCNEVPHLQKLEESLQNPNVVFVSISTDSGEQPWRTRMEQLKMHGNQWLNTDGKLCDKLNVSGIPHFLIYDKEGHLHTYSAARPSSGEALKAMLEGLK